MRKLLVVLAFGLASQPAPAADPAVGRIFFTPEQRAQLDLLRNQKAIASQKSDEPVPEIVTYNGIIRRSDGKATVWINNEALSEADLRNKQSIVGSIGRDGQVTLQAPQTAVQLKVGQSATLFSGKVEESFTSQNAATKNVKPKSFSDSKATPTVSPKDIPPELLEAIRNSATSNEARSRAAPETQRVTP
jgi:hypothetical protein